MIPEDLIINLHKYNNISILTGAGVSAESGLATFRGQDGFWQKYRPEELATPEAFDRNPKLVWEWYQFRRNKLIEAKPNAGHLALAKWETLVDRFTVVTQNVDGLHQLAGSRNVLELHGNIRINRCIECGKESSMEELIYDGQIPRCECQGMLRPGVVWFGESLPEGIFKQACRSAEECDLFISAGTSSVVFPAASLIQIARQHGAMIIEINKETTPLTGYAHFHLSGATGEILPELVSAFQREP